MKKSWQGRFKRASRERRTSADGEKVFASLAEKRRYQVLQQLEKVGHIRNLQTHVAYALQSPDGRHVVKTKTGKAAKYTADFVYEEKHLGYATPRDDYPQTMWREVIEDVKGFSDRIAELRIAVFEALTGKTVTIIKSK